MAKKAIKKVEKAFNNHVRATLASQTINVAIPSLYQPFGLIVLITVVVASRKFGLQVSETGIILYTMMKILPCVGQIAAQKNSLDKFFPSYEQIISLRKFAQRHVQTSGKRKFSGFEKRICLNSVSFAYPEK